VSGRCAPAAARVRGAGLALLALMAGALGGCDWEFWRSKPAAHELLSSHTTPQASSVHRVAVLPFYFGQDVGRAAAAMNESLPAALRELGLHEVISIGVAQRDMLLPDDPLAANHLTIDQLLKLRDALHCDAVLIGRIEQFDSFDPISVGGSAHLVSCLDGTVPWSATGHFDGHRQDVQDEIADWYGRAVGSENASISGWRSVLQSPRLFTRYVAERLVLSIPMPAKAGK
jgi:hypothetical protein